MASSQGSSADTVVEEPMEQGAEDSYTPSPMTEDSQDLSQCEFCDEKAGKEELVIHSLYTHPVEHILRQRLSKERADILERQDEGESGAVDVPATATPTTTTSTTTAAEADTTHSDDEDDTLEIDEYDTTYSPDDDDTRESDKDDTDGDGNGMEKTCTHCHQQYLGSLSRHTLRCPHRPVQQFPCPHCTSSFSQRRYLTQHQRIHLPPQFRCRKCGARFRHKRSLEYHFFSHSGENPYQFHCPDCDECFTHKQYLSIHERRHSGAMPYVCESCRKAFRSPRSLTAHKKIAHDPSKSEFPCSLCPCAFSTLGGRIRHTTQTHCHPQ